MTIKTIIQLVVVTLATGMTCQLSFGVTTETVPVGNAGNLPDQDYGGQGPFGAVTYDFRISTYEVTNAQYAAFLNSEISIFYPSFFFDPLQLFDFSMEQDPRGGIRFDPGTPCDGCGLTHGHGIPAQFRAKPGMENKPVNFVNWNDAARYANWLNFGDTETGGYNIAQSSTARLPGATWFLPSEDEWYKAAYHQPGAAGGDSDDYWLSPTRSNAPTAVYATADSAGNINNPGVNVMNESGAAWNGQVGNVTTVGSAGPSSASYYGTFDQGGNVEEWLENSSSAGRVARGGSWENTNNLGFRADHRRELAASYAGADVGFRVVNIPSGWPGQLDPPDPAFIVLDGVRDANYRLRSVQSVQTGFGDNLSELNAAFARIHDGKLYLMLTGNLETNFNKLNVFIDSVPGGQNRIGPAADEGGTNPNNDDWAENYSGVGPSASGNGPGFTFDEGFAADYLITMRHGFNEIFQYGFLIDYAVIGGGADAFETATGVFRDYVSQGGNENALPGAGIGVAFNHGNGAGVIGGSAPADLAAAAAVQTGFELAIPLSALGNPNPRDILVSVHINGFNHDFLSNQSLPGFLAPQLNPGGDGANNFNNDVSLINLNDYAGVQYFAVVPEPSSAALACLAVLGSWIPRPGRSPNQPRGR